MEQNPNAFVNHLSPVCAMIGRASTDANPDMKIKAALFAGKLALALGKTVG